MRLSQDKIHDLAGQIFRMMRDHPDIHVQASEDAIRVAVGSVITDDLQWEDDIDRQVDELITRHGDSIESQDLDVEALRRKFKQEIARREGFVL